jgi:hypothetical protein
MRARQTVLAAIMATGTALGLIGASASSELPQSFAECVVQGGNIRQVDGELTCRLIQASDFRIYGTATDDCGEEVPVEIWGEARTGAVTYLMDPARTVELPEIGGMDEAWPTDVDLPCSDD